MNRTFASYTPFAALAAVFALGAVCLAPARADAACSAALQAHVRAGTAALDRSAGGRSASAAAALGRNVDLASGEIGSCPDPQTRRSYDELVAWKVAFELANRGPDPAAARVLARRLRDDLARFYRDGGAASAPEHYAILKETARRSYALNGLVFCSPDRSVAACALAARSGRPQVAIRGAVERPACAVPDADATIVVARPPEYPDIARAQGVSATSQVRLTVGADGKVADAAIYHSSGNLWLDRAAIVAANESTYRPARRHCRPVAATSDFRAEFAP